MPVELIDPKQTGETGCKCCTGQTIFIHLTFLVVKSMHMTDVDWVRLRRSKKRDCRRDAEQRSGGSSSGTTDRLAMHTPGILRVSRVAAAITLIPEMEHELGPIFLQLTVSQAFAANTKG